MKAVSTFGLLAFCLISDVHCEWSDLAPSSAPSTSCTNEPNWKTGEDGFTCTIIQSLQAEFGSVVDVCHAFSDRNYEGKSVYEACCTCGGSDEMLVTPSNIPSKSVFPTTDPSTVPTVVPTLKPSNLRSAIPSNKPSISLSPSVSKNPSASPSNFPSKSHVPTRQPSQIPTSIPSQKPTNQPTLLPTNNPTHNPSSAPSQCQDEKNWKFYGNYGCDIVISIVNSQKTNGFNFCEFIRETVSNGKIATEACCICGGGDHIPVKPSSIPTMSTKPSSQPSTKQSKIPSQSPSLKPSSGPTGSPSLYPSGGPSANPSGAPSGLPSAGPSAGPSCEDDRSFTFMTDRAGEKKCKWIGKKDKRIVKYCNRHWNGIAILLACSCSCNVF